MLGVDTHPIRKFPIGLEGRIDAGVVGPESALPRPATGATSHLG